MTGKKHDQKSISRDSLEVNSVDSLESNDNSDDSIQVLNDSLGKDIFYKVESFSWKTKSHKDHLEFCLPNTRLLSKEDLNRKRDISVILLIQTTSAGMK